MFNAGCMGYRLLRMLCLSIPTPLARLCLPSLAYLYYRVDHKHRKRVQKNLAVLGEHLNRDLSRYDRKVFYHFACFLFEFFSFRSSKLKVYEKDEVLRKKVKETMGLPGEKGVLLLVNHQGNWEIALKKLLALGYPVTTVALRHGSEQTDAFFSEMRFHPNLDLFYLEEGANPCVQALEGKRILALACERDYTGRGIPVQLAGKEVKVPVGPAYLHHKTGSPVVKANTIRKNVNQFEIALDSVEIPENLYKDENVIESLAKHIMPDVFSLIYEKPEQWITFDDFFRERPKAA